MALMVNIVKSPIKSDSLIRIYNDECLLNESAAKLLQLTADKTIIFTQDRDELALGRNRIYITACDSNTPNAFHIKQKGRSMRVYSTRLCQTLANNLEGYGTYRICPEVTKSFCGKTYYEIFFKKFE